MRLVKYYLDKGYDILYEKNDEDYISVTVNKNNKNGIVNLDISNGYTEQDLIRITREAIKDHQT